MTDRKPTDLTDNVERATVEVSLRASEGASGPYAKIVIKPRETAIREIVIDLDLGVVGRLVTGRASLVSAARIYWRDPGPRAVHDEIAAATARAVETSAECQMLRRELESSRNALDSAVAELEGVRSQLAALRGGS